jgi:ABC-type multidrug transport system ATPase subunit/ABC-type multidrug transport system permease subunit
MSDEGKVPPIPSLEIPPLDLTAPSVRTPLLSWFNVTVENKKSFPLFEVSGSIHPGRMTALIGPSGSGKSLLLKALSGRVQVAPESEIYGENSFKLRNMFLRRNFVGLVCSEDEILTTMTPRETLRFSIGLRNGDRDSKSMESTVNYYIHLLGLIEYESKRISENPEIIKLLQIGNELINERRILLFDSILNSLKISKNFEFLKKLKNILIETDSPLSGVLCTLNQPTSEILSLFDDIILVSDQGRVIYQGPLSDMAPYFTNLGHNCPLHYNVTDFALFVLHSVSVDEKRAMMTKWKNSSLFFELVNSPRSNSVREIRCCGFEKTCMQSRLRVEFFTQLRYLTQREFLDTIRNWKNSMLTRFLISIVVSVTVGLVYFQIGSKVNTDSDMRAIHAYRGLVMIMCVIAMLANSSATVVSLPSQRKIFQRENGLNLYSSFAYLLSKVPIELILTSIQILCQLVISYFLCELKGNFLYYLIVLLAVAVCAESAALCISSIASSTTSAIQALPVTLLPQIIFSGLIVNISSMPTWIAWFQYICFLPYAVKLLFIIEFGCLENNFYSSNDISCDDRGLYAGCLVAIATIFRIVALLALQLRPHSSHQKS